MNNNRTVSMVADILMQKYHAAQWEAEQAQKKKEMAEASLPRNPLKPKRVGPIITPETQAKLDLLQAEQQEVEKLKAEQAITKQKLDAVGAEIKKLKAKMGKKKRSPEAEAAYQSNLPMFRRLGVLA